MNNEHIPFHEVERGEGLDEAHLATCRECRERATLLGFLRFQIDNRPDLEPPSGFASRVTGLVSLTTHSIWASLERVARTWLPVYAAAAVIAILLIPAPAEDPAGELLVELAAVAETDDSEVSVDDVIYGLVTLDQEEPNENQD